jgi:hypothetical protein
VIQSENQPLEQEAAAADAAERAPLGRLLVEGDHLSQAQLDDALYEASRTGERIGEVVVRRGLVSEDDIARLLADQWGLEYVERSAIWFDPNALGLLSREDAQRLEALPTRIEGGHVVAAVAEPTEERLEALRRVVGDETVVIVVPKSALEAGLRSQLLASRGDGGEAESPGAPPQVRHVEPVKPVKSPRLTAVAPPELAALSALSADESAEAVVALAAEARAVAERLATQAEAVRAQAQEQNELRRQAEQYELRIAALERELEERQAKLDRARRDLRSLLDAL